MLKDKGRRAEAAGSIRVVRQALGYLRGLLGRASTAWLARQTQEHLAGLRIHEIELVQHLLPARGRVLEIGAGTGWQAKYLAERGYEVVAIDVPSSTYARQRVWPVILYDGHRVPFADGAFDAVFSSNTLEHIGHVRGFQRELQRVLKRSGIALHLVPTGSWRFWTNLTEWLRTHRMPVVHGAYSSNAISEIYHFSARSWRRLFVETGWQVVLEARSALFYTGHSILDDRLPIAQRQRLSHLLGSACHIFVLRVQTRPRTDASPA